MALNGLTGPACAGFRTPTSPVKDSPQEESVMEGEEDFEDGLLGQEAPSMDTTDFKKVTLKRRIKSKRPPPAKHTK